QDVTRCRDDFQRGYGAREIAVLLAGAVSRRRARADYGNMRQGSEIVQRESVGVEIRGELAIGDAAGDSDAVCGRIDRHDFVHGLQREEAVFAVGNVVEGMTGAEDLELAFAFYVVASLLQ